MITSHCHASGLAAGSDEGSAAPRVAGHPLCTCHLVPAPSAALAAIYAVVTQESAGARPATCVLLCYRASCSGFWVWAWDGPFFPLAMSVAEACPVVSWQHAIHSGISVLQGQTHQVVSKTSREKNTTLPANPLPALGVWPLPRLRSRSRSRYPAPRYPLGMPLGIDRSMPVKHAKLPVQARRQMSLGAYSQDAPLRQGPLACDLLLMTERRHQQDGAAGDRHTSSTRPHTRGPKPLGPGVKAWR